MKNKKLLLSITVLFSIAGFIAGISLYLQPNQSNLGVAIIIGAALLGASTVIGGVSDSYDLLNKITKKDSQLPRKKSTQLYKRDYNNLNNEEQKNLAEIMVQENVAGIKFRNKRPHSYPKAVRHNKSLFPNNYMDFMELKEKEKLDNLCTEFETLLNSQGTTERSILNFIKDREAYFIIASILKNGYGFGHHDAFVFQEFQLGNSWVVDFLIRPLAKVINVRDCK